MKYLQILNAALLILGATMSIVLGVVCLLYWVHLDADPALRHDVPLLLVATGVFSGLTIAGMLAFLAHRRQWALRWMLQALPVLPLAGLYLFVAALRA